MPPNQFRLDPAAAERYEEVLERVMRPFVTAVVDRGAPGVGDRVLDLACGTGYVAREVRHRLGAAVTISGVDPNPVMLAVAARVAPDIDWQPAPAHALPYDDDSFDVVLCQQGLQFFPDLTAALREVRRVLRPGGRLVGTVWADRSDNPYLVAQYHAVAVVAPDAAEGLMAAVGLPAEVLTDAAAAAGLADPHVEHVGATVDLGPMPQYAADHLGALPWGAVLAEHGPDTVARAAAAITAELLPFRRSDGVIGVPIASRLLTTSA